MKFLARLFGSPGVTFPVSLALLMVSSVLVFVHAVTIRQVKEIGLPASVELPQMQRRLELLKDQVEAAELQEALGGGSAGEQLRTFVLPEELDLQRLLATFDILHDALENEQLLLSMSPIQVGEIVQDAQGARSVPVSFQADVTKEGMDKLLLMVRLSGLLTISDALTPPQLSALINLTEEENPAALTVLEQFLASDLLRYSRGPLPYENQVLRSLTSEQFEAHFRDIIDHSLLAKARYLFGGPMGDLFEAHNLWPNQMFSAESVAVQLLPGGHYRLSVELAAHLRSNP